MDSVYGYHIDFEIGLGQRKYDTQQRDRNEG